MGECRLKPILGLTADDYTDIDLTNMRKTIASRLSESKNNIPHNYLTRTIRTDTVNQLRAQLNQISETKISVNDFIIKELDRMLNFSHYSRHDEVYY